MPSWLRIPIAGGMALANKLRKNGRVTVACSELPPVKVFYETQHGGPGDATVFVARIMVSAISVPTEKSVTVKHRTTGGRFSCRGHRRRQRSFAVSDAMRAAAAQASTATLLECKTTVGSDTAPSRVEIRSAMTQKVDADGSIPRSTNSRTSRSITGPRAVS